MPTLFLATWETIPMRGQETFVVRLGCITYERLRCIRWWAYGMHNLREIEMHPMMRLWDYESCVGDSFGGVI